MTDKHDEPTNDETAAGYETPEGHRSGFVALVGRPNVGKSLSLIHISEPTRPY